MLLVLIEVQGRVHVSEVIVFVLTVVARVKKWMAKIKRHATAKRFPRATASVEKFIMRVPTFWMTMKRGASNQTKSECTL